jgi:hypothetical protein
MSSKEDTEKFKEIFVDVIGSLFYCTSFKIKIFEFFSSSLIRETSSQKLGFKAFNY